MAEPKEASPVPDGHVDPRSKASRPITVAAAIRQMERQSAPLRAEMARGEGLRRQIDQWAEPLSRVAAELGLEEESAASSPPVESAKASSAPTPLPQSEPASRPAFELEPGEKLLAAMRQAFPGFKPTDQWWFHAERELKDAHQRSHPEGHAAFCAAYWGWSAEDLICHLEAEGRIKLSRTRRGPSVCERLRGLHKEDPDFAETASERAIAKRIGKGSPGCLSKSHYWNTTLRPRRAEIRARAQMARAGIRSNAAEPSKAKARADNWDQRDAIRRLDSQIDGGH